MFVVVYIEEVAKFQTYYMLVRLEMINKNYKNRVIPNTICNYFCN